MLNILLKIIETAFEVIAWFELWENSWRVGRVELFWWSVRVLSKVYRTYCVVCCMQLTSQQIIREVCCSEENS